MYKIIVAVVIASCILLRDVASEDSHGRPVVKSGVSNNITIDKFIGEWYETAVMYPLYGQTQTLACNWFKIEKDSEHPGYFNGTYRKYSADGSAVTLYGNGRIWKSEIYLMLDETPSRMEIFATRSFDNDNDVILIDISRKTRSIMISRKYPASLQARAEFERLAGEVSSQVFYLKHDINCTSS